MTASDSFDGRSPPAVMRCAPICRSLSGSTAVGRKVSDFSPLLTRPISVICAAVRLTAPKTMTISVMAERRRLRKMLRKARVASMCVLLCGDGFAYQRAVAHAKAARRARDEGGVVRGEDEGGARLGVEPLQKIEDL